jgi:cation:H+ antiporter
VELIIWSAIFIISLFALIKAADWIFLGVQKLSGNSETGLVAASICVVLPELAAAIAAVAQGKPDLAVALVIGSSVANILLVTGIGAVAAKSVTIKQEHVDQDLPLFVAAVAFFCFVAFDGEINFFEGMLSFAMFFVYSIYIFSSNHRPTLTPRDVINPGVIGEVMAKLVEVIPTRLEKSFEAIKNGEKQPLWKTAMMLAGGSLILVVAANFTIQSLLGISEKTDFSGAVIAAIVLAICASLPEIFAGLEVARKKRYEIMMGNVYSAVTINLLLVAGVSALFATLPLVGPILTIGLPFLAASSLMLAVSSISHRINFGEGMMFLFFYFLFFVKLLDLF